MKNIKKFLKCIWEKKEWIFSGIGVSILAFIFTCVKDNMVNPSDIKDTYKEQEKKNESEGMYGNVNGDVTGGVNVNGTFNFNGDVSFNLNNENDNSDIAGSKKEEIIMSESKYLAYAWNGSLSSLSCKRTMEREFMQKNLFHLQQHILMNILISSKIGKTLLSFMWQRKNICDITLIVL